MTPSNPTLKINPLAVSLNQIIAQFPTVDTLLSQTGKRLFYPTKGIVAQSAEAKKQANPDYNATVGIATDHNGPLAFKSICKFFNIDLITPYEIFDYTGSFGNPQLRKLWKERIYENNPSLSGKEFSLPVVTGGLTNALSIASDLFFDPGDTLILPDQIWGNYKLMLETIRQAQIKYFSFFHEGGINLSAFQDALTQETDQGKPVKILLNFPNNPTGYSPTQAEADKMIEIFSTLAEAGHKILVILDEAYHGLFFEDGLIQESLFSRLVNLHKNILTIKICGATKEFYVWGFRVGFISFGIKGGTLELYTALEQKTGGLLRGNVSNESTSAQNILLKILKDKSYKSDMEKNFKILKERALEVKRVLAEHKEYTDYFEPYPFNSGYFMLLKLNPKLDSDTVRRELLQIEVGTISTAEHDLRVAFSCVEKKNIEIIFNKIYEVCKKLMT